MHASVFPGSGDGLQALDISLERTIDKVLSEAARRGERWFSLCRIPFILLTMAPFVAYGRLEVHQVSLGACLAMLPRFLAIVFSLWVIRRTLRGPVPVWVLGLSVAVDAILAFLALLENVLPTNPDRERYLGNFRSPDGAVFLIIIACSGFRLSSRVVWLSAGLNTLLAGLLILFDQANFKGHVQEQFLAYRGYSLVLMAVYFAGATALALLITRQSRALAVAGARDAVRAHHAQRALNSLLQDHHDVRSVLSSVNLHAELIVRGLDASHPQRANAEYLREDLRTVSALITALRERSFQELASADGCLATAPASSVRAAASMVARRFPNVSIECDVPSELCVRMAGGAILLDRVLLNLMINACEGDGTRGAARIWIRAHRGDEGVVISVEDDGPGFPDAMLLEPLVHTGTSKSEGSGLGLFLARSVVMASAGRLTLGQRPGGGACVMLTLPEATN